MDNSLSAPAIRQMFLDFFTEKVGHGHGRVVVGVGYWVLGSLQVAWRAFILGDIVGLLAEGKKIYGLL